MTTSLRSRRTRLAGLAAAFGIAAAGAIGVGTASADGHLVNEVVYSGQGLDDDGNIEEEICDGEDGYVLFVLAGTKASEAELDGVTMDKSGKGNGGAFKLEVPFELAPDETLLDYFEGTVAAYDGDARNAQLVISHGCPGNGTSS